MFQYNPKEYERITDPEYIIKCTYYNEEHKVTMKRFIVEAFKETNKDFPFEDFLNEYEFLYDDIREQVLLIIRGARLRLRKYFHLPPIYIAFPMTDAMSLNWEPQMSRYLQKMAPIGFLNEESKEDAYKLSEHPFSVLYHPHIDSMGFACYGNWGEIILECTGAYQIIENLRGFVNDYNGRSTFYTVNPYAFDRKENINTYYDHFQFPQRINSFVACGYPRIWQSWSSIIEGVFGNNWILEMCEELSLNYETMNWIHNYITYIDKNGASTNDYYSIFDDFVKNGGIEGVEYYQYPGDHKDSEGERIRYNEDEWEREMKKYKKYEEVKNTHTPQSFSNYVGLWLQSKIGYNFSKGDLSAIKHGLKSWVSINLERDIRYKEKYTKWKSKDPQGFRIHGMLETMGTRTLDSDGPNFLSSDYASLVFLLASNSNIDQILRTLFNFEDKARDSLPNDSYHTAMKEAKMASAHKYSLLEEKKMLTPNMSFENGKFYHSHNSFDFRYELPYHFLIGRVMSTISSAFKNLVKYSSYCSVSMQQTFFSALYNSTPDELENIDFEGKFSKVKVNKEQQWLEMMRKLMVMRKIDELSHDTGWFWDELNDSRENFEEGISLRDLRVCFGGEIHLMDASQRREWQDIAVRHWYKFFPSFPNSIEEIAELRFKLDREIITHAMLKFKKDMAKAKKEYENVLKNTLPSVEQGELFSQEISVN